MRKESLLTGLANSRAPSIYRVPHDRV